MVNLELNKIREDFYSIEFGAVRCFLFVGDDRALLIDAGFPDRGLIDKVREVTELPIEVVYSHTDGDHRGDIDLFDTIYIHPAEMDYLYMKQSGDYNLKPLWEGQIIEIGPYSLEVVLIPGHTPGSIGLLERQERFMLTGDTVHYGPVHMFGPGRNLEAYLFSLKKLKGMEDAVDVFYNCHHNIEAPVDVIDDLIQGVSKVIDQQLEGTDEIMKGRPVKRYSYGRISFYYR